MTIPPREVLIIIAFFAGLGLPALSGFISEALCFIGGFSAFRTITIIGTLGILLNAIYFLRAYQRVFTGPFNKKYDYLKDISKSWSLDRKFSPKMKNNTRNKLIKGWSKAIKRALIN